MTNILVLDSASTGEASVSRKLTREAADLLRRRDRSARIVTRDVGAEPVPHLTAKTVPAIRAGLVDSDEAAAALALSDALVAELAEADILVIPAPMHNFCIPPALQA